MVHLRPCIANDFDVFREKLISVLQNDKLKSLRPGEESPPTKPNRAGNLIDTVSAAGMAYSGGVGVFTVFFFARSPDAPSTTIMVLSLSSIVLCMSSSVNQVLHYIIQDNIKKEIYKRIALKVKRRFHW